MEAAPNVVAENARNASNKEHRADDADGFLSAPAPVVARARDQVFKYRRYGGEARKRHEEEEERAPDAAAGHVEEDFGQRHKNERGTLARLHIVAEAGGENDETGHDCHKRVQRADAHRLAGERAVVVHIAAENLHGGNAETERKERLVHGIGDHVENADGADGVHVRAQIKVNALCRAGERQTVDGEHNDKHEQADHHDLCDFFKTLLHAAGADEQTGRYGDRHKNTHFHGIAEHVGKHTVRRFHCDGRERAGDELEEVGEHPAGDGGIIHHQQQTADDARPAVPVPFAPGGFKSFVAENGALPARAADGQLHRHHGNTHNDEEQQIKEDKIPAAVLSGEIGELPDVSDADGASGAHKNEPDARIEVFSLHFLSNSPGRIV